MISLTSRLSVLTTAGGTTHDDVASMGRAELIGRVEAKESPSDESLLILVRDGDQQALALLFRRHARGVRKIAYRVLRDQSEADDLVQEVFLLVHRQCAMFDSSKSPAKFWILQMAYRRAISRRRYLSTRHFYNMLGLDESVSHLADPRSTPAALDDSIDLGLESSLHGVFAELSVDQQRTFRLFFIEGYTFDEIATKLGHTRGNVKNHYFRGLEKLRKALFGGKLPGERAV